jgi:predicted nucleic acid-binding protein
MSGNYIFDSSVWIDLSRNNKKVIEITSPIINKDRVVLVDLIMAEVLRGVTSSKDYELLEQYFLSFKIVSTSWIDVAKLAFKVARHGHNPPLADLYIAHCAINNKLSLITRDRHFEAISGVTKFIVKLL